VGRIDATKKALFAARLARRLLDCGRDLRFLAIGEGAEMPPTANLLGEKAVLPGYVRQEGLGWIYPSADCFLFPSETDTFGKVVIEAKASGLPVLVAVHPGVSQHVQMDGQDGYVLSTTDPDVWYRTVDTPLESPESRRCSGVPDNRRGMA
jgi:glycosyltransferase involved in cell wall biosynthesis